MGVAIKLTIALISLLHLYFLWLEMFAWTSKGPKVFRKFPKEHFAQTKSMAANQGLYNGFLAAGLLWTFFIDNTEWSTNISLFFLGCISAAGIYGAFTVSKKIFFVQALPALLAIILIMLT